MRKVMLICNVILITHQIYSQDIITKNGIPYDEYENKYIYIEENTNIELTQDSIFIRALKWLNYYNQKNDLKIFCNDGSYLNIKDNLDLRPVVNKLKGFISYRGDFKVHYKNYGERYYVTFDFKMKVSDNYYKIKISDFYFRDCFSAGGTVEVGSVNTTKNERNNKTNGKISTKTINKPPNIGKQSLESFFDSKNGKDPNNKTLPEFIQLMEDFIIGLNYMIETGEVYMSDDEFNF